MDLRQFDVAAVLEEASALLGPLVNEGGGELVTELSPSLGMAAFDRDALMQILINLIDNAEKYSRGASTDRRIHLCAERTPDALEISVRDHGPGIPASLRPRLFKAFVGADTATKTAGLGLGLSVVALLTRAHGGSVRHEETPGGGTTCVVVLPQRRL